MVAAAADGNAPLRAIHVKAAIDQAAGHLERRPLLVVSDFDGTLSKIVSDPWGAEILPLGRRALRALSRMPDVHVAVLTGRTARDAAARIRVGGIRYVGNHGMERGLLGRGRRAEGLVTEGDTASHEATHAAERLADEMPSLIREPWLIVERKPPSVAFHWRQAPDVESAGRRVAEAVDKLDPYHVLERFQGRRVLEVRPFGAVAKGEAFEALVDQTGARSAFLLGDDISDALAFKVLRRLRSEGKTDGVAVAVQARAEVPADVLESADIVLASPVAATQFLSGIARRLAS